MACLIHPRRPTGSQSGREKRRDESFQVRAKEPLGTDSHRTISKNSSRCRLLIGHKKCFVLLCPIGEQFLLSSFREFVHDGYCLDQRLVCRRVRTHEKNSGETVRRLGTIIQSIFCAQSGAGIRLNFWK